ncbi:MAG TPA: glycosyltransferase family 39 protein [Acidimicrobiia bacterium]|jgi:4-amino-4-deoxy-L-arabinose transferase-like glycosyltransferase|nr:glycosyltransferase family 39 protein [Acidimicrobiia bacterium]
MPAAEGDDRRFWRILLLIALAALALRVGYVAFAKTNQPIHGDQLFYNAEANRLARGDGFLEPFDPQALSRGVIREGKDPAADHPPLTVIVLAPVSFVTSQALIPQRLTMSVLGTGAVVVIGLLARRLAGDRAGWIAAGIAAVYPNLWVNDGLIMSETLATLVVALALLYAYRLIREPSVWNALIVGALCGLGALTRAELVLLVPLLAVPAALVARSVASAQRWKLAGIGVLAAAVLIAPWVGYNLARFDEPTYLSTNDGIALLGSNCDSVYFGDGIGLTDLKCLGPNPRGDQSVDSKIYRDRAFDYIRDHKKRAVLVTFARVGRTWSLFRPWDMVSYNKGEGREGWVTTLGLIAYYPLLIAAVAGWVVMRRRRRRSWPLLVPVLIVTIASAATYGQTRFRVPAEPTLVVLAAVAIAAVVARDWPARRKQPARPS